MIYRASVCESRVLLVVWKIKKHK